MKKFIWKVCVFAAYAFILTVVIPVLIDPYNIFHIDNIRYNGVEPNKNFIKMSYIIENPDKFDSLLFGSSRVGSIHVEKIVGEKCYNMTYSAGIPSEHLENIKTLIQNNVIPKKIYIGLDSLSYTEKGEEHYTEQLRCPYEYSQSKPKDFYLLYLNPYIAFKSLITTLKSEPQENYSKNFYEYGWWCEYDRETKMDWSLAKASIGKGSHLYETLDDIKEIVDICNDNGIELIVFTNPMYELTYEASIEKDYLMFLRELVLITPYYNFSGINDVTSNKSNYIDTSHYNAYVGDMILDCICNGVVDDSLYNAGFGVYVTNENVDEVILKLTN